jgi:glutaredoxin 2
VAKKKRKTLGQFSDELYDQDQTIKKIEKTLKEAKQLRAEVENEFLRAFEKDEIDGCKGSRSSASIRTAQYPTIKNRNKFEKYVLKKKAFDLFQSRVTAKAYFARLDEGETVPGVEVFERIRVSVRKRGNR